MCACRVGVCTDDLRELIEKASSWDHRDQPRRMNGVQRTPIDAFDVKVSRNSLDRLVMFAEFASRIRNLFARVSPEYENRSAPYDSPAGEK